MGRERGLPSVPHFIPSSKEPGDSEHRGGGPTRSRTRKPRRRTGLCGGTETHATVLPSAPHRRHKSSSHRTPPRFSLRSPTTWASACARRVFAPERGDGRRAGRPLGVGTRTRLSWDLRGRTPRREEQGRLGPRRPASGVLATQQGNESQTPFRKILTIQSRDRPPRGKGHMFVKWDHGALDLLRGLTAAPQTRSLGCPGRRWQNVTHGSFCRFFVRNPPVPTADAVARCP